MTDELHAFDALTIDGLRRRGSVKWNSFGPDVLAAWVAEMDFPAAPPVRAAILDAADREEFGYPQPDDTNGLPEAVAGWELAAYGWPVDARHVHTLPDVLKGVELGVETYSPEGSAVILSTPAYMPFFDVPKVVRRPITEVPTVVDDGVRRLDLDGIDHAFAAGAGTIVLCQPYNPLGRSFTRAELLALCAVVTRHGARVVSDEVHAPLTYSGRTHIPYASISPEAAAHSVTVVSASKAWNLPGLKCAQLITTNDVDEERWHDIPQLKTHGASTIGIRANVAAFTQGGPWLAGTLDYLDGNRRLLADLLAEQLPEVRYTPPEATYLAWLDCRELDLPVEPADFFRDRARVATSPGPPFGSDGRGHLRFNFATSRAIIEQAVEAMAAAVRAR